MRDFSGKVSVITGGASGIGLAMAERFAREGMKVVLADIEQVKLGEAVESLRCDGVEAIGAVTDVSSRASIEELLAKTLEAFGAVHVLCNNAGVQVAGPTWQISQGEWEWILGVNLWGVIHGVSVFVPRMLEQGDECHIVNTSSMSGLVSVPMMSAYQVTKHAVVTLSESLSQELKQQQASIGVSVLCPAFVQTNLHNAERNRPSALRDESLVSPAMRDVIREGVQSLVTTGKPASEIADAVVAAIRSGTLHILTHPELATAVERRAQFIVKSVR